MEFNLEPGLEGEIKETVTKKMTAVNFGSGDIEVLATPVMIGFMEHAALKAVDPKLPEGFATVGYKVDIKHLAPTPVGMEVVTRSNLEEVDGRKLVFKVHSFDEKEKIGEGTHIRYIVETEKLQQNAENKSR